MKMTRNLWLATIVAGGMAANASAAVLVNDTWQDGTRIDPASPTYSEDGIDGDADGLESAWFATPAAGTSPVTPGALTSSTNNLRMDNTNGGTNTSSSTYTTYFKPDASAVTLGVGETLKVTWQFTPTAAAAQNNTSQNFRVALVDSVGRLAADGNSPPSAAYTGYGMFMNMSIGAASVLGNSGSFRLMERNVASGDILSTGGNWVGIGTTGSTAGNHGYDSGTLYTFTMAVTRNVSNGLDFDVKMAGGTLDNDGLAQVVFTDTTPHGGSFSFDTFVVRPSAPGSTADRFDTSLFRVELIQVPEPASFGLLAVAVAAAATRRRRA